MSDIRNWKKIVENATKVVENDAEDVNHTDHEVSMAKSQLLSSVKSENVHCTFLKDIARLFSILTIVDSFKPGS